MRKLTIDESFIKIFYQQSVINCNGNIFFDTLDGPHRISENLYLSPGALYSQDKVSYLNFVSTYVPHMRLNSFMDSNPLVESLKFPLRVENSILKTTTSGLVPYLGETFGRQWRMNLKRLVFPKSDTLYIVGPLTVMNEDYTPLFMGFMKRSYVEDKLAELISVNTRSYTDTIATYNLNLIGNTEAKFEFFINPILFTDEKYAAFKKLYEKYLFLTCVKNKIPISINSDYPEILPKIARNFLTLEESAEYAKLYASRRYISDLSQVRKYTELPTNRISI